MADHPAHPDRSRNLRDWMLVGLQAFLFLAVALTALFFAESLHPMLLWAGLVLILAGSGLLVWAGVDLGSALTPLPTSNGQGLVAKGAFHYVRHPIYVGVLIACLGVAVGSGSLWTYLAATVTYVFFEFKTRYEEASLVGTYAGYAEYAARTGKFIPGVQKLRVRD